MHCEPYLTTKRSDRIRIPHLEIGFQFFQSCNWSSSQLSISHLTSSESSPSKVGQNVSFNQLQFKYLTFDSAPYLSKCSYYLRKMCFLKHKAAGEEKGSFYSDFSRSFGLFEGCEDAQLTISTKVEMRDSSS